MSEANIFAGWLGNVRLNKDLRDFIKSHAHEYESPNQALGRLLKVEQWKRQRCPKDWRWYGRVTCTQRAYQVDVEAGGEVWSIPFLGDAT